MKENYAPWAIDINSFPEKGSSSDQIKFLLGFVLLAPSGHNGQPWNFSISETSVSFYVNKERSLPKSDPERRQLLAGFGCAVENFLIASDYYGFNVNTKYFPDQNNKDLIIQFSLSRTGKTRISPSHLIFSIPKRNNNRNKFKKDIPPQSFQDSIKNLSGETIDVSIINEQDKKEKLGDIVNTAQIEVMDRDYFREELSHLIRSNFTKEKTGMPGFVLGLSAPISLIASRLIKKVNMSRKTKKQDDELLKKYTPTFVVISTISDSEIDRIKAGQLFERIWLMAEKENLKCSPLAAGCQVGEYYKEMQKVIGISSRPQVFFRLGYCDKENPHSPRFLVKDLLN